MSLDDVLALELAQLKAKDRFRFTQSYAGPDRAHPIPVSGSGLISFCSNDYLGLATHPRVRQAAADSASRDGVGAGASRLVSGETPAHRDLERQLARYLEVEDVLLFPSGYQANIGTVTALAGPGDFIASDAANHASLIDGCRLSRAKVAVYEHASLESARGALAAARSARRRFIVTESLFSMDGDRAPLRGLDALCREHDAHLIVDEAHALGCIGPSGRGISADLDVHPTVLIGTLGKAFGTAGGFVAASRPVRDTLVNRARTYIYTTAAPGPVIAATAVALEIIASPEGTLLRRALQQNCDRILKALPALIDSCMASFIAGLPTRNPATQPPSDHIIPIIVGSDLAALHLASALQELGMLVPAIRPPTVPEGTARLRLTVSAAHSHADLDRLLVGLSQLRPQEGHPGDNPAPISAP